MLVAGESAICSGFPALLDKRTQRPAERVRLLTSRAFGALQLACDDARLRPFLCERLQCANILFGPFAPLHCLAGHLLFLESRSSDQRCYHIGTKTKNGVPFCGVDVAISVEAGSMISGRGDVGGTWSNAEVVDGAPRRGSFDRGIRYRAEGG